jgi:hypothetical protein
VAPKHARSRESDKETYFERGLQPIESAKKRLQYADCCIHIRQAIRIESGTKVLTSPDVVKFHNVLICKVGVLRPTFCCKCLTMCNTCNLPSRSHHELSRSPDADFPAHEIVAGVDILIERLA